MVKRFNYGSVIKTAERLIKRFGSPVTIVVITSIPNPAGDWKPPINASVRNDVDGVFLNYETKFIDGTLIQTSDQKVLVTADKDYAPNLKGFIERNGIKWNIIRLEVLNPGDTKVLYTFQVRQ